MKSNEYGKFERKVDFTQNDQMWLAMKELLNSTNLFLGFFLAYTGPPESRRTKLDGSLICDLSFISNYYYPL